MYPKGGHLLCHDDVIGTRCVSYIIYLTDPDGEWPQSSGGALELYPVRHISGDVVGVSILSNSLNSVAERTELTHIRSEQNVPGHFMGNKLCVPSCALPVANITIN